MQICFVWCLETCCHSDCDTYFLVDVLCQLVNSSSSRWFRSSVTGGVHVFWMAENKYVNKEENTVAPGDNSLWVKVFLGIFLQMYVLEGGWWTSVYLIGSEWGDHRADGLETVLKHWQLQQDFSLDVGAFHCSYFSSLSPAKKCAEPLMWFLY